ncbi:hypothetical protein ABZW18_30755 [Streptomyces sp. NPDC004647]|uniref:hypothetical protein n=1 Tax=Streptomyces sp. NPDC004647 TaxID=3154671 RepID=UPI0033A01A0A
MSREKPAANATTSDKPAGPSSATVEFLKHIQLGLWGFFVALIGAGGGAWVAHDRPSQLESAARVAASMIGIIIGAIIAALAIITRACDTAFLEKAKAADRWKPEDPILPISRHLKPFFTVIALGLLSGVSLMALSVISSCTSTNVRMAFSAAAGFLSFWTLAGLLPAMGTLIHFTYLIEESVEPRQENRGPPT